MSLEEQRSRMGREPFFIVDLYLDYAACEFGVGACTATGEKCYKTLATCKDAPNYDNDTKMYRYCSVRNPVPFALEGAIPCVDNVEITPARIDASGSLGARGVVSVTLRDLTHNDFGVDPYLSTRSYDPLAQGTYFGRFKARNRYYTNRKMVVHVGWLDVNGVYDPANFRTFTYFIESFDGPDNGGKFKITGKDLLKQLDSTRALCPKPNVGKLLADISDSATALTLTPGGVGADYSTSGVASIGSELVQFTRSGDNITLTSRGYSGTTAASHSADDTFQQAYVVNSETVQNIVYELGTDYANIPVGYIPKTEWDQEQADYLPRLYSAIVAKPTGVKLLTNELLEQTGTITWWDEESAEWRFKSIRALSDDVVTPLGEWEHLLEGSVSIKEDPNARLTSVHVYYGIIDPTKDLTDPTNYRLRHVSTDPEASSSRMYDGERIKTVFSRWITAGNAVAAIDLGDKILSRFRRTPRRAAFALDEKDGALKPGAFVQVSTRTLQKADGSSEPVNIQILSRKFKKAGTSVAYEGSEFFYLEPSTGPSGQVERLVVIAAPVTASLNLRTLHDSIYADLRAGDVVRFRILSGVYLTGPAGVPAVDTGEWPVDVDVYVDMLSGSYFCGWGGRGASWTSTGSEIAATSGGTALVVRHPIALAVEAGAYIYGGRGGGAAIAVCSSGAYAVTSSTRRGAGGGAHARVGAIPGRGGTMYNGNTTPILPVPTGPSGFGVSDSAFFNAARDGGIVPFPGNSVPSDRGNGAVISNVWGLFDPMPFLQNIHSGASGTFGDSDGGGKTPFCVVLNDLFTAVLVSVPTTGTYTIAGATRYFKVLDPALVGYSVEGNSLITWSGAGAAGHTAELYGRLTG